MWQFWIDRGGTFTDIVAKKPDGKIIIDKLLKILPEKLIYISCNIMTQYRDIELIKDFYVIRKIQPIDMFPQTHHIENIVLLEKF